MTTSLWLQFSGAGVLEEAFLLPDGGGLKGSRSRTRCFDRGG
jgi:hypothetical protein